MNTLLNKSYLKVILKVSEFYKDLFLIENKKFSKVIRINKFTPKKIKLPRQELKNFETADDERNLNLPRVSLTSNSPTTEIEVIKYIKNKHKIYPNQHPRLLDNEDTSIISYKKRPLALVDDFNIPRELRIFKQPLEDYDNIEEAYNITKNTNERNKLINSNKDNIATCIFESPINSLSIDVAIIGPTNSGKSSLLNSIINKNISSVSSKYNTTYKAIEGVYTDIENKFQMSLIDTPGAFRACNKSLYASNILTSSWSVLNEVDKVVFVVDAVKRLDRVAKLTINRFFKINSDYITRKVAEKLKERMNHLNISKLNENIVANKELGTTFNEIVEYSESLKNEISESVDFHYKNKDKINEYNSSYQHPSSYNHPISTVLVLNKIDLVTNKRKLKKLQEELESIGKFDKVFYISCETGYGIENLKGYLKQESFRRPWKYHPSVTSTLSETEKMEQIIRQNVFKRTYKEVPYQTLIELQSWVPLSNGELSLVFKLEVKNKNQRAILVGRDSLNIKEIKYESIKDMSLLLKRPVKIEFNITERRISNLDKYKNMQYIRY